MSNSNDKVEILKEMAVFNYVAGSLSEPALRNFESMLGQDPALQQAVETERSLRANMQKAGELEPVSMGNFDALIRTIEADQAKPIVTDINQARQDKEARVQSLRKAYWNPKPFAVAASIAVFSVMSVGLFLDTSEPKFNTLSDGPASEQLSFSQLSEQGRLAKMIFSKGVSASQIENILSQYDLTTFEAGAAFGQHYVITESTISDTQLRLWRGDERIQQVEVFTTTKEK